MKAIAEGEIDDAITSPEGHGGLCPFGSQWMQARTDTACQDDADRFFMHRAFDQRPNNRRISGITCTNSLLVPAQPLAQNYKAFRGTSACISIPDERSLRWSLRVSDSL